MPPGIIHPDDLALFAQRAPDRDLVLTLKLAFHYAVRPAHLKGLNTTDLVLKDHRGGTGIFPPGRAPTQHYSMPPLGDDVDVFSAMLPPGSGPMPLFVSKDPWARLRRFAAALHIDLPRNCGRRSAALYAWAFGLRLEEIARRQLTGSPPSWHRPLRVPVTLEMAISYWTVPFDLDHISRLPRYISYRVQP